MAFTFLVNSSNLLLQNLYSLRSSAAGSSYDVSSTRELGHVKRVVGLVDGLGKNLLAYQVEYFYGFYVHLSSQVQDVANRVRIYAESGGVKCWSRKRCIVSTDGKRLSVIVAVFPHADVDYFAWCAAGK